MFSKTQTYYDILEIPMDASPDEVLKAYIRSKETYSSDSPALYTMFSKEEAYELLKLIEHAYTILSNPIERQKYDESIQVSSNESLPDINFNEVEPEQWNKPSRTSQQPPSSNKPSSPQPEKIPEGFSKTKFSVYEISEEMEEEIQNAQYFNGPFLQKIRIYKNITADQIVKEIRISRAYLAGIESDDYEVLPAKVFVRGFLIQIAKILGLDPNKVAHSYLELYSRSKK